MTTTALRMPTHTACATRIERLALRFAAAIHARAIAHMTRRIERASFSAREATARREALLRHHADARRDAVARAHTGLLP